MNILAKIFGTQSERDIKKMNPYVQEINDLEPQMKALSDDELKAQTEKFRQQLKDGAKVEDLVVPAFATLREASVRFLNMRDFDVQLKGGIALTEGKIAEMKTGEGKTLVATLAVYLEALEGKGVHVITVNDYLAKRDSEWMAKLYRAMGMSVGAITHEMDDAERKVAYNCDITYGTNTEFGFDYLRDNMKFRAEDRVQRGHHFALVDEVDSVLIDEARTPLIISGPSSEETTIYNRVEKIVPLLKRGEEINADDPDTRYTTGDYIVDEKRKTVTLTDEGMTHVEELLNMNDVYDAEHMNVMDHVQTAIRGHVLYELDTDYIVRYADGTVKHKGDPLPPPGTPPRAGEVIIVDEFTGRLMPGRRWSQGLHPAIEAKEGLIVQPENQTLATITIQNYFRMYDKLAGMTGTAETEAAEFGNIYKTDVIVIPTNKPSIRKDFNDVVYRTEAEKFRAVAREIKASQEKGQPVLIGTAAIEKSEMLSQMLTEMGVKHEVLNAKNNEREAAIIAQAGRKGAVTVSTNMAGRGTDILLGGNPDFMAKEELVGNKTAQWVDPKRDLVDGPQADGTTVFSFAGDQYSVDTAKLKETVAGYKVGTDKEHDEVVALGGLYVIGTERHDSRRVDNQLRGRAGRQGDPGCSRFFISLEDHLARIWGGDKLKNLMTAMGMDEETPIESRMVSKAIEKSQRSVEEQNFMARKNLIEYDDVMNIQRKVIYAMRNALLDGQDEREQLFDMAAESLDNILEKRYPEGHHAYAADWSGLSSEVKAGFGIDIPVEQLQTLDREKTRDAIMAQLGECYEAKEKVAGPDAMRKMDRNVMLSIIDEEWKDHLYGMDYLKDGIGLQSYAQKDPLVEYKKQAYEMFVTLLARINDAVCKNIFTLRVITQEEYAAMQATQELPGVSNQFSTAAQPAETQPAAEPKPAADPVAIPGAIAKLPPPAPPAPPQM